MEIHEAHQLNEIVTIAKDVEVGPGLVIVVLVVDVVELVVAAVDHRDQDVVVVIREIVAKIRIRIASAKKNANTSENVGEREFRI